VRGRRGSALRGGGGEVIAASIAAVNVFVCAGSTVSIGGSFSTTTGGVGVGSGAGGGSVNATSALAAAASDRF